MLSEQPLACSPDYQTVLAIENFLNQRIIGQEKLIDRMLIALLTEGHLLVEGAPGLAKTTAIKALAECIEGDFHRVQFTPDLLPADLTGTDIFHPQDGSFSFQQGPLFHNIILADEINRAPAKVQSALLEAMAERQITIGRQTYQLPQLYMVMATQNPIEQEGTYPLPEAQLDRFLLHVRIDYPDSTAEQAILQLNRNTDTKANLLAKPEVTISEQMIFDIRKQLFKIHMSPAIEEYLVQLVIATRKPKLYGDDLASWINFGASPRATIGLDRCARAHAWLCQRDYVTPEDIHTMAHDVLRHRILLSFSAEADSINTDQVIDILLNRVAVP